MKFTRKDIADNKQLITFLRGRIRTSTRGQAQTSFHDVVIYDTQAVIKELEDRITKYKTGRYARFTPTWKTFVEYLKEMEKCSKYRQ